MPESFDSNVVLYLVSADPVKSARSAALLTARSVVSVQVFNEFTSVMRRKFNASWSQIDVVLSGLENNHTVVPVDMATHTRAFTYAQRYQFRIYDANIVAAAVLAGCTTLWSEDMHNGLVIDGLTIRDPYR